MRPFRYVEGGTPGAAVQEVSGTPGALFYAGGTTLVDLMKIDVMTPAELVDINRLPFSSIEVDAAGVHVGANVRNSELAWHPVIRERYPVLTEAILSGATTQIRNMATTAGNLLQRTRCPYFRDVHARCHKRVPGSGCDALDGVNRMHAILGTSQRCIAVYPSDMAAALAILEAVVHTEKPDGSSRDIPFLDFHLLPGDTPERETVLEQGELITRVDLPNLPFARRSHYLKVRDRASYEFALASAAVALDLDGDTLRAARIALGGVATKPWRCPDAEEWLAGRAATAESFIAAAEIALAGSVPQRDNAFKIDLAKQTLVQALLQVTARAG